MKKQISKDISIFVSDGIVTVCQGISVVVLVEAEVKAILEAIKEDDEETARLNDDTEPDFGGQIGEENAAFLAQYD